MQNYKNLTDHYKKIAHFKHLSSIMHWDQAVMMPDGGNHARSQAMATLSLHIHELITAPNLGELFDKAESEALGTIETASLYAMKRHWQTATVLPRDLIKAKSLAGSKCEHAWRIQRQQNDWNGFSKNFAEVVNLAQQEAQIRSQATGKLPYDAMLDLYEPDMNIEKLNELFGDLATWLPNLTQQVQEQQKSESFIHTHEKYPIEDQKQLGLAVMKLLHFNFDHGRLDISSHPFCGGVPQDVRITTRYDENDFGQSLMGIIHETGHANYEQGLPVSLLDLPVGEARSMGIHESQSLFFEMQLGRSKEFINLLSPLAKQHFKQNTTATFDLDNLHKTYTRVKPGLIRVDADEVTYPAHVILRYEIERDLINCKISYQDIPELWDLKMQKYLGLSSKGDYKNGCMQDIHWTDGSFGYFPSYTLGAMYAAQFMASMKKQINVSESIEQKNFDPIFDWLAKNIWSQGSIFSTDDLVKKATNETLNPLHFRKHLEVRYLAK